MSFDYNRPAAVFMESPTGRGRPLGYRRFWSATEAIRFAVEELPVTAMQVCLERLAKNDTARLRSGNSPTVQTIHYRAEGAEQGAFFLSDFAAACVRG
jgi:hypothetical protein